MTYEELNAKIKQCPICGGTAQLQGGCVCWFMNNLHVQCDVCGLATKRGQFEDELRLVNFWNTRHEKTHAR